MAKRYVLQRNNISYHLFKKINSDYLNVLNQQNPRPELVTRLLNKKNNAHLKAREAANESCKANRRAKTAYYNTELPLNTIRYVDANNLFGWAMFFLCPFINDMRYLESMFILHVWIKYRSITNIPAFLPLCSLGKAFFCLDGSIF